MDWLLFVRSSGSWPQFIRGIRRRAVPAANARGARKAIGIPVAKSRNALVSRPATGCPDSPAAIYIDRSFVRLRVAQAASNDPRIQRDHRGSGKDNYVFHILAANLLRRIVEQRWFCERCRGNW